MGKKRFWKTSKDPENLTEAERQRVLDYCLGKGNYPKDEIVNYKDLFIQSEFLYELTPLKVLQDSFKATRGQQKPFKSVQEYYEEYGNLECSEIIKEAGFSKF